MAVLGRSYLVMQGGFQRIEKRLPFPILEVHPDNGSEFLNDHLVRFWQERAQPLELSRSRPYYKNDNRFVEENNFSQVRAYAGYNRLDTVAQTHLLNQLYEQLWIYHNFFQPVMRLHEKRFQNGHVKRIYDSGLPHDPGGGGGHAPGHAPVAPGGGAGTNHYTVLLGKNARVKSALARFVAG